MKEREDKSIFDNPLSHGILTKGDVALLFKKSEHWVIRMAVEGKLPHHYVGDTMMFFLDEVIHAFLGDRLEKKRRHYVNSKKNKQGRLKSLCRISQNAKDDQQEWPSLEILRES